MKEEKLLNESSAIQRKKPYSKPAMEKIGLIPEEAVLALCKNNTGVKAVCDPTPACDPFNPTS